jgi:lactate dehydrogenase-like 2-hydroxyacid dehydrogenase
MPMPNVGKPGILVVGKIPADLRTALDAQFALVEGWSLRQEATEKRGFQVAVTTGMDGFDAALMDRLPDLRLIASQGVGLERIDLAAAAARNIKVTCTPNILTEDVADFAIGLLYGIARRVVESDRFVRGGRWGPERISPSSSLHRKNAGVVGMGRIGQAIALRAAGIGMKVAYHGPRKKPDLNYRFFPEIGALAADSDVLLLSCRGGPSTAGIVDANVLKQLGPAGFLINVSRGEVVDESALLDALEKNEIAGAGLDVFATEPKLDPRFIKLDNVVLAPHSASITQEVRAKLIACMIEDISAFVAGNPLRYAAV